MGKFMVVSYDFMCDALEAKQGRFQENEARKYFQQLINAIDYCHSRGVYHRDLKPENLFLDTYGALKVADFRLSAFSQKMREDGLLRTAYGTSNYVAPEVLTDNGQDGTAADVWSCGVILFVLTAGYLPFDDPSLINLYKKVFAGERLGCGMVTDAITTLVNTSAYFFKKLLTLLISRASHKL